MRALACRAPEAPVLRVPEPLARARGVVELAFKRRGAGTVLDRLYQQGCGKARVLRPEPKAPGPEAVLINTAGGLTGGDDLRWRIEWHAGCTATVTSQAAEKVYRSLGDDARIETRLAVAREARAEWLPQETILFDRARVRRRMEIDVETGGSLLACEAFVFGRTARGEVVTEGFLHDAWRVRYGGRLVWADALRLDGAIAARLACGAITNGARAVASVLHIAEDAGRRLELARTLMQGARSRAAATCIGPVLIARFLAPDGAVLRRDLTAWIAGFRAGACGLPARLPRVWSP